MTQYVQVEFRPGGKRYTYLHSGEAPIEAGVDRVEIKASDGALYPLRVLTVSAERPDTGGRPIKPVVRVMPRTPAEQAQ